METRTLVEAMERVRTWPAEAQDELADIALEMDAALRGGDYQATADELAGIDRGLAAAERGEFASAEEVAAVFAKHRHG